MTAEQVKQLALKLGQETFGYLVPAMRFGGRLALEPIREYLYCCLLLVEIELKEDLLREIDGFRQGYVVWKAKYRSEFEKILRSRTDLGPKKN